jgi:hypothetical protein
MTKLGISGMAAALVVASPLVALAASSHHSTARSGSSTPPITKTQALRQIETAGYTDVQDLRKEKGGWTAKAMESGKPVSLLFDGTNVRKE